MFHWHLFEVLAAIAGFQYLLIAGFLFSRRSVNILLGAFFFMIALNLADGVLMLKGFFVRYPALALWEDSLALLYGPLLYLYTILILYPNTRISARLTFHAVPFVALIIAIAAGFHFNDQPTKVAILERIIHQDLFNPGFLVTGLLIFAHFFTYLLLCLREINRRSTVLAESFSSEEMVNLKWLRFTLRLIGLVFALSFTTSALSVTGYSVVLELGLFAIISLLLFYINFFVLRSMKQPAWFAPLPEGAGPRKGYAYTIDEPEQKTLEATLQKLLERDRVYLDPDLTLDQLAGMMSIPPRKLSQYINDHHHSSFYELINTFRIDEARRLMTNSSDPRLTVQEVMYQSGFVSRSSFNTLFKKKTGLTPTAFRKSLPHASA